jgi:hypothetical protein
MKMKMKIKEATFHRFGFPDDGSGVTTDDDRPPGNIVLGTRYVRKPYSNRLTPFDTIWDKDETMNWTWDYFENITGMEDPDNYSNTIEKLKKILPNDTWQAIVKHRKFVPDKQVDKDFDAAGQPYRTSKDVLRKDKYSNEDIIKKIDLVLSE